MNKQPGFLAAWHQTDSLNLPILAEVGRFWTPYLYDRCLQAGRAG